MIENLSKLAEAESSENIAETLSDSLKDMTPETAEAFKNLITEEMVEESLGVAPENAEGVTTVVTTLFDEISKAQNSVEDGGLGLTEEEYAKETSKIANLLDVTMSMSDGTNENEINAEEYVDSIMDSKILTNTITNSVYDENGNVQMDPLNTGADLDSNDQAELIAQLQKKLDENPGEENEKLAVAIAAYMNIDVRVVNGQIIPNN